MKRLSNKKYQLEKLFWLGIGFMAAYVVLLLLLA